LVESTAVRFKQELEPHLSEGVYMNFLNGKEARRRTAEAFTPHKYARLKALKAKYDPDNLFRFGYDINP
jgi:FAD/FMN-containing dehydrogenase